jgi:hypothetical protein
MKQKPLPKTEKQIRLIIEDRLSLQSTSRSLELYRLPSISLNYFESADFARIYETWDEFRKRSFLKTVAGEYQYFLKGFIERNLSQELAS